jgi:hypothetical protein
MSIRSSVAVLLSLVVLTACEAPPSIDLGADDAGPDDDVIVDDPVTIDDVVAAWGTVACDVFACANHTRTTAAICAKADVATGTPFGVVGFSARALAAGDATFDVDNGAACLTVIESMAAFGDTCVGADAQTFAEAFGDAFDASCGALLVGTVAVGEPCVDDSQCADGNACLRDDAFAGCARSCRAILGVNDSCVDRRDDCQDDARCDGTVCVSRNLTATGAQCFGHEECASGRCFDFVCAEKSVRGGECVAEGDCQFGQYCRPLPPSTGLLGICEDFSAAADECGFAIRCAGNQLCAGFARRAGGGNTNGVCRPTPADVGDPCVPVADGFDRADTGCFGDLVCNPATLLCEEAPALGAPCTTDRQCGFEGFCDQGDVCQPSKARGEAATEAIECTDLAVVSQGVCADFDNNTCPVTR